MTQRILCAGLQDTCRAAHQLAGQLSPGSCVAMEGGLGAGKTAFFGFIADALGAAGQASSPTYVLMQQYTGGRMPIYHFDLYRLGDEDAVQELGLDEYFSADGVALIEWPGAARGLLPKDTLHGHIRCLDDGTREITITGPINAMEGVVRPVNVLVLDTSGQSCGVGVYADGAVRYESALLHGRTHSDAIMPMIDQALLHLGMRAGNIDVFCAVTGPGSFTGVRIGVAVAQAMAQAGDKMCVGLSALEVLAAGIGPGERVAAWMDARRDQVYEGLFPAFTGWPGQGVQRAVAVSQALEELAEGKEITRFVGDGALAYRENITLSLGDRAVIMPGCFAIPRMAAAAELAAAYAQDGKCVPALSLAPSYLRLPQAERERLARLGGGA